MAPLDLLFLEAYDNRILTDFLLKQMIRSWVSSHSFFQQRQRCRPFSVHPSAVLRESTAAHTALLHLYPLPHPTPTSHFTKISCSPFKANALPLFKSNTFFSAAVAFGRVLSTNAVWPRICPLLQVPKC